MKRTFAIPFAFLACLAVFMSGCGRKSAALEMSRAADELKSGLPEKAMKRTLALIGEEPENAQALLLHALVCEELGDFDSACNAADKATKCSPDSFAAWYLSGRLEIEAGHLAAAERILAKAVELKPDDADARILLVNVLARKGDVRVMRHLAALVGKHDVASSAAYQNHIGVWLILVGNLKSGGSRLIAAAKLEPHNHLYQLNMARYFDCYVQPTQKKLAGRLYRAYLAMAPGGDSERPAVERTLRRGGY